MPHLIWTPLALSDVQRLYRFLLPKNKEIARRAIKEIRASVKILVHHPEAGRPIEDMDPEFREWVIDFGSSGYIAVYRFNGEIINILSVRHQKEDNLN